MEKSDKIREKFNKFSHMVMNEAVAMKKDIISQAEKVHDDALSAGELQYLKKAYDRIQQAVRKIEKETNEEVSKSILESKQALFNRREEIINTVFQRVNEKLLTFKQQEDYKVLLMNKVRQGLEQVGSNDARILVDSEDICIMEEVRVRLKESFEISESDEKLFGGFLIVNKSKGYMCDYSFITKLDEERAVFLENYGISID